jgi:hypothetical protein
VQPLYPAVSRLAIFRNASATEFFDDRSRAVSPPFVLGGQMTAVDVLPQAQLSVLISVGLFDRLPRATAFHGRNKTAIATS